MVDQKIRFDDGAGYEQMMGIWRRFAGEIFLDWLAPLSGFRWIDIGCGNGAFAELFVERCAPAEVQGIDPSEGQLAFARTRSASCLADFRKGDGPTVAAMASTDVETLKSRVQARLPADTKGRITYSARAHAIKGHLSN